jgi:hypothetical protein
VVVDFLRYPEDLMVGGKSGRSKTWPLVRHSRSRFVRTRGQAGMCRNSVRGNKEAYMRHNNVLLAAEETDD